MHENLKPELHSLIDKMDFGKSKPETEKKKAFTLWVRPETKYSFDRLQQLTNRQFGRDLLELIIQAIEVTEGKYTKGAK